MHKGSVRASHPAALGSIVNAPKDFFLSMLPISIDGTTLLRQWTMQKLNNVDTTHLVLLDVSIKT